MSAVRQHVGAGATTDGDAVSVSVFYQIGTDESGHQQVDERQVNDSEESEDGGPDEATIAARKAQEHEFRIGCVGVSGRGKSRNSLGPDRFLRSVTPWASSWPPSSPFHSS